MDAPRVLLIEDDEDIAEFLRLELEHEGYAVTVLADGRSGLQQANAQKWDIVLLDVMLPGLNGFELCRRLRLESQVPILMLTARGSVPDRIAGLDYGADDYVVKPFAIEELLARIRTLMRRASYGDAKEQLLTAGDLELSLITHQIKRAGQPIRLTAKEFALLQYLVENKNSVLTRDMILHHVWGYDFAGDTNILDVYISYLRAKVDSGHAAPLIHTVRGVGFTVKDS